MDDEQKYTCPATGERCEYELPCVMFFCAIENTKTAEPEPSLIRQSANGDSSRPGSYKSAVRTKIEPSNSVSPRSYFADATV